MAAGFFIDWSASPHNPSELASVPSAFDQSLWRGSMQGVISISSTPTIPLCGAKGTLLCSEVTSSLSLCPSPSTSCLASGSLLCIKPVQSQATTIFLLGQILTEVPILYPALCLPISFSFSLPASLGHGLSPFPYPQHPSIHSHPVLTGHFHPT